ncbi:MAG TPA: substrate-binding domain-containing protein [Polyangiaceae bacterium]|nr:substrate-binding domain-containing protein [Polyangiaceae bacterium]
MRNSYGLTLAALAFAFSSAGCSSDSADSNVKAKKAIERTAVQESIFKPKALEETVDALVSAIAKTEAQDLQLNVILKSVTGYWSPVVVGANRALGELEVSGAVASPQQETGQEAIDEQNAMIASDRSLGSKGFGVAPFEKPVAEQIDASVTAGLPVVTIDSDLPESKRDMYIGTLNKEAGATAGNTLKGLLPAGPGTVIVLGHDDAGWQGGYERSMAAKAVFESAGYSVTVRRTDWTTTGEASDLEALAGIFADADPPVVGMIGMFSNAYRCAMAAEAAGRTADDIAIVAFDFDPKTVDYMRSGLIKATHAQRQYYMGYLTPYVLYGMNVLGKDATKAILGSQMVDEYRFNSGLDVVMSDQLDEYYSFLDGLGVGGS